MRLRSVSLVYLLICLQLPDSWHLLRSAPPPRLRPGDHLAVSGLVTNPMGKGLKEVEVEVLVNGRHVKPTGKDAEIATGKPGGYVADFILPPGTLPAAKVEVQASKPSWKPVPRTPVKVVEAGADAQGNKLFQAAQNLTLEPHHHRRLLDRHPRPAAGLRGHLARVDAPHPGLLSGRGPHRVHHLYPGELGQVLLHHLL